MTLSREELTGEVKCSLVIAKVVMEDSTVLKVIASNPAGTDECTAELTVKGEHSSLLCVGIWKTSQVIITA